VLPADDGRGPREVADPNFVPLSFKTCGSAGHLLWKSAALTDLESFGSALIKQGQEDRQCRQDTSRFGVRLRLSAMLTHTHTHTHTHFHSASSLFYASAWNVVVRVSVCLSVYSLTRVLTGGRKDSQSEK
jgi:hypothetical protein